MLAQLRLPLDAGLDAGPTLEPLPAASVVKVPVPVEDATVAATPSAGARVPTETDVVLVRHRRARRYILRVTPDGQPRVTIPRGGSTREALRFFERHRNWFNRQVEHLRSARSRRERGLRSGDRIWFRGVRVTLDVEHLAGQAIVSFAGERVQVKAGQHDVRGAVEARLRDIGRKELPARVRELARLHALVPQRVVVRGQRSRWGSCSPSGTISLNWRLVQAPDSVRDYVILHELMHLEQPNHSRRFWTLVTRACPWHPDARAWLRRHGDELH